LQAETLLSLSDRLGPTPRWSSWLTRTYSALAARSTVRGRSGGLTRPASGGRLALPAVAGFDDLLW